MDSPAFIKYVNAMEAARQLGCSRQYVCKLIRQRRIRGAQRFGFQYMIPSPVQVLPPKSRIKQRQHTYGYETAQDIKQRNNLTTRQVFRKLRSGELKGAKKLGRRMWMVPMHYTKVQEEVL